ncbi:type IV toxin-antitoxin system AbiEi family antitoxin domain-containing protein [Kribbella solani]|uniref:type IV toxin-antitoxin system AbiEi family antitoxin domain-containing protein n=1 Tax=Kribbella solani TaxID=236067 RepID=UPI0029ABD455|nr:type IV toxin-antitoxin system AbiEi family antitoxin domain-containing protein [Kribbella solani]MDX2972868.1 type IV toxin-antitoxin system AbiEi family antitoxin domain-containing protein [Kribbella solani]
MNTRLEIVALRRGGWFSRRDAISAGYSDADLRQRVASGRWVRLARGAYADTPADAMPAWERAAWIHVRTARAVYHRLHGRAVVSHQSALFLHGVRVSELDLRRVHVTRRNGPGRSGSALCQHASVPPVEQVTDVDGVQTTTVARAVVESVCAVSYPIAVSVVDQALRLRITTTEQLSTALGLFPRRPGIRTATAAVQFGDGRAESVGESQLRVLLADLGFPTVLPQAEIRDTSGRFVARVDFLLEQFGVVVEFDGAVKYGDGGPNALFAEKVREDRLRDLGYQVVRVTRADLTTPVPLALRIRRAITRAQGSSVAGYVTGGAL